MAILMGSYQGSKWDVSLDPTGCDRYNNADLTLTLRVHLQQVNPPGAAAESMMQDAGSTARKIVRWTPGQWRRWTQKYQQDCQRFWHGKFWLMTPTGFDSLDFQDRSVSYRPNVWCRFRLQVVDTAAAGHHSIKCVRLHPSVGFFRSHSRLYDHRDLEAVPQAHGGLKQTHIHEVGHLLGLGHSAEHRAQTCLPSDTNATPCYGTNVEEQRDVMGSGSQVMGWHVQPWREALERCTDTTLWEWGILMRRSYPRTMADVAANRWVHTRPSR